MKAVVKIPRSCIRFPNGMLSLTMVGSGRTKMYISSTVLIVLWIIPHVINRWGCSDVINDSHGSPARGAVKVADSGIFGRYSSRVTTRPILIAISMALEMENIWRYSKRIAAFEVKKTGAKSMAWMKTI